jgi:uncharacterized protein YlxW (UPF0749 family)
VMDQRVISTSAVRCVGNTLILNGRTYGPPFTMTAIGDPVRMRESLDRSPQMAFYREWVREAHLGYDVEDTGTVVIPAFTGSLSMENAQID